MSPSNTAPHGEPVPSVRLIFEYEGDRVRLVAQHPVEMAVTGFDLPQVDQAGYFVESRNASDHTLARVAARNAFLGSAEVFPENHAEPITRVDVPQPKGAFTVVVPVPDTADHVTVTRLVPGKPTAPADRVAGAAPARHEVIDLVSFPLDSKK